MKINKELELMQYMMVVEEISNNFFDNEANEYLPYIGELNAMRVFFNNCVVIENEEYVYPMETHDDMVEIVKDGYFLEAYNAAIKDNGFRKLDFANAYKDAKDIVEYRKGSIQSLTRSIESIFMNFMNEFKGSFTDDKLAQIGNIVEQIGNGKITEQAIVDAYGNSDHYRYKTTDFSKAIDKRKQKSENRNKE